MDKHSYDPVCVVTVTYCSRCEGDHKDLRFTRFTKPYQGRDGAEWTHFAMCPTVNEPILLRIEIVIEIVDDRDKTQ